MKKLFTFLLVALALTIAGCSESFDDSKIWDKLNDLENRIAKLEELCKQMNTNISSLQSIVKALQNNDYVTGVTPITKEGETVGYTITFTKSQPITIYHGKDGKDGSTPIIGVKQDTDNIYYWTLNGEWLLDANGNKIKAQGTDGEDGADGKDGITPQLKIENDYWYISYDNGATWMQLGKATGENGISMIESVTYDDKYIYITLNDGTKLVIPLHSSDNDDNDNSNNGDNNISDNKIWFTSTDGTITIDMTNDSNTFGAHILSVVYDKGKGVITFDGKITTIGTKAFYNNSSLTSMTIPNSVSTIGTDAFNGCSNLETITIPESVISIGVMAFYGCASLTNITIPNTVTKIGNFAFAYCIALTNITIPESVSYIGESAFSGCSALKSIKIPNSITEISPYVFCGCSNLEDVTMPQSIVAIGNWAFARCDNLTFVIIPEGVSIIGESAFQECKNLEDVTIPTSVTKIKLDAFYRCPKLKRFRGDHASDDGRCLICGGEIIAFAPADIEYYNIPEVTKIGNSAFKGAENIKVVHIPKTVTAIGNWAFYRCTTLDYITIPVNVSYIGDYAFYCCDSLDSIEIRGNDVSLGIYAFANCPNLSSVYCRASTPPAIYSSTTFNKTPPFILYVPINAISIYENSAWSNYASTIKEYDAANS